ncbi:MAG TPA: Uma2 family endonuclease [Longimicrobium sp.]|nr:Uma2 family endonuclease [Longimicrobium sp.]
MASRSLAERWTYDEFAALPDDGNRYEVIAGELYVTPAPRTAHQEVLARLIEIAGPFVRRNGLGRMLPGADVLFGPGDYLEPDIFFVRRGRTDLVSRRGVEGAPDLVVEILSDSTAARDRGLKRERYAHFGVAEYWIIDVDARQIEIHRPGERLPRIERDTLRWQPVLDGPVLEIDVQELLSDVE